MFNRCISKKYLNLIESINNGGKVDKNFNKHILRKGRKFSLADIRICTGKSSGRRWKREVTVYY